LAWAISLGKATLATLLFAKASQSWAHALGTDPTVIERIDAGLMMPSELSLAWIFWLIFGLWIVQNLDQAAYFFCGAAVGIASSFLMGAVGVDVTLPALLIALVVAAWMCVGQTTPALVSASFVAILSAASMMIVFSVHSDLSSDQLIRIVASASMLFGASFFGGLFKQIQMWLPNQTPIGIRILSSWMVALIAIQLAMHVTTP
jgi:hypothetical protein